MKKIEIPKDKKSFKIGEVARLLDLEPYVLRYWETEFKELKPEKSRSGQRAYKRADIEGLMRIQELLYVEQYTIAGARRQLELGEQCTPEEAVALEDAELINQQLEAQAELFLARIQSLEQSLEQQTSTKHAAFMEAEQRASRLSERVDELIERLDASHTLHDEQQSRIVQLETEAEQAGGVDDQWSAMTSQLGEDMERMEQELQMAQQLNAELELVHGKVLKQCEESLSQRDQLQAHCTELMTQRAQLEAHCDELSARLRAQRQGRQRTFDQLRQELVHLHSFAQA